MIQTLPTLLQTLREGLALIGVTGEGQSARIKLVTDTLAEAFVSKTATIAPARIEAMAQRLSHLEQYISEDGMLDEDMPLSPENIEMILGVDTAGLNVIPSTNTPVDPVMLEWAPRWSRAAGSRWTTTARASRCNTPGAAAASSCTCSPRSMAPATCCSCGAWPPTCSPACCPCMTKRRSPCARRAMRWRRFRRTLKG